VAKPQNPEFKKKPTKSWRNIAGCRFLQEGTFFSKYAEKYASLYQRQEIVLQSANPTSSWRTAALPKH